jgi:hypothetical protein
MLLCVACAATCVANGATCVACAATCVVMPTLPAHSPTCALGLHVSPAHSTFKYNCRIPPRFSLAYSVPDFDCKPPQHPLPLCFCMAVVIPSAGPTSQRLSAQTRNPSAAWNSFFFAWIRWAKRRPHLEMTWTFRNLLFLLKSPFSL